ncbi:Haloacid dehalogenase-like hydrolase, partial [Pseudoloma neurophilia]
CPIRPNEIYFEKETESNDQWSCPIRPNEIYFEKETDEKHFFHGELEKILENSANRQLIVKDSIDLINDDRKPHLITLNRESFEYFKHILPQVGNDKILVFDIDNTLYPEKSQAEYKIHQKYLEWLEKQTGISKFEINKLSKEPSHINDEFPYMVHRKLNLWPGHYNHMIQSIDYTQLIKRNEQLKEFLDTLPYRKFCLTNNSVHGATKILNVLGIDSCFEAIFAIDLDVTRSEILKPTESAYKFVTEILQVKNNKNIIFFDDKEKNVHGAIKCGWNATQIKSDDEIIVLVSEKMAEYWKVV